MIIGLSGKKQHGKDTVAKIIQVLTRTVKGNHFDTTHWDQEYESILRNMPNPDWDHLFNWQNKKFGTKLKEMVCLLIGCTMEQLEDSNFKEKELGEEWNKWCLAHYKWASENNPGGRISNWFHSKEEVEKHKVELLSDPNYKGIAIGSYIAAEILTPRRLLQIVGTEGGRNIIHPNIWVNALFADYEEETGFVYPMKIISTDTLGGSSVGEVLADPEHFNNGYPNWIISDVRFPNEVTAIEEKGGFIIRVNNPRVISTDTHESETALDNHEVKYIIDNDSTIEGLVEIVRYILLTEKIINS